MESTYPKEVVDNTVQSLVLKLSNIQASPPSPGFLQESYEKIVHEIKALNEAATSPNMNCDDPKIPNNSNNNSDLPIQVEHENSDDHNLSGFLKDTIDTLLALNKETTHKLKSPNHNVSQKGTGKRLKRDKNSSAKKKFKFTDSAEQVNTPQPHPRSTESNQQTTPNLYPGTSGHSGNNSSRSINVMARPPHHSNNFNDGATGYSSDVDLDEPPFLQKRRDWRARCQKCPDKPVFTDKREWYYHQKRVHQQGAWGAEPPSNLNPLPWNGENNAPWGYGDDKVEGFEQEYKAHSQLILQPDEIKDISHHYNVPIDLSFTLENLIEKIRKIYQKNVKKIFKINFSFGRILHNRETDLYRYFTPGASMFNSPFTVNNQNDLLQLFEDLRRFDFISMLWRNLPDTKWSVVMPTNIIISMTFGSFVIGGEQLNQKKIGCNRIVLPDWLKNKRSLLTLLTDSKGKRYPDNLCMFRCLAVHELGGSSNCLKKHRELQLLTEQYFREWVRHNHLEGDEAVATSFSGVPFRDVAIVESLFKTNINIFSLGQDDEASSIYRSVSAFDKSMNLDMIENHVSFITNLSAYSKKFVCKLCRKCFDRVNNMQRHMKTCKNKTKFIFPGGYYKRPKTVFDELEELGINVFQKDRFFDKFAVFDFEACLKRVTGITTPTTDFTHQHIPISVSVCSNHVGFTEPQCFVNPDLDDLVVDMLDYLEKISESTYLHFHNKFSTVFEDLKNLKNLWKNHPSRRGGREEDVVHTNEMGEEEEEEEEEEEKEVEEKDVAAAMLKKIALVKQKLENYCLQLPILGFNSQKYDLNLIKTKLTKFMVQQENPPTFVVKKGNTYSCLGNMTLKFLDITNYLSPGTSYAAFLRAFDVPESKGFFPYEWMDDVSKLDEKTLPPLGPAWHSSLKNKSVLDDGIRTIEENYNWLKIVWETRSMTTIQDFLVWYNNLDTAPFVKAVVKLQEFYYREKVDIFKSSMSAPGIARSMVFAAARRARASLALMNEEIWRLIKKNLVGGPSIIFNRHQKVGETPIRENYDNICKHVIGFDANALYLYAFSKPMPVGMYIHRRLEDNFQPRREDKYNKMFHWMDWLNKTENLDIKHERNNGVEIKLGPFPLDGFDGKNGKLFQFHGCYWHGHNQNCPLTRHAENDPVLKVKQRKRRENTERIREFLNSHDQFKLVEIYECEYDKLLKQEESLRAIVDSHVPPFSKENKGTITDLATILKAVQNETLFGMLEVDIEVPESWDSSFKNHPNCTPKEYYGEMSPIFGTMDIEFAHIGHHMQEHVINENLSKDSRRLLIGGMAARKMLFATPLLKWYLDHGMKITKVYQIIEFSSARCFTEFTTSVSKARRLGDVDPSKSIIADTNKLLGNSGYGGLLLDRSRHRQVSYVDGARRASQYVNKPEFISLQELGEETYEILTAKTRIKLDLPIQIGFFILNYAKLRMLEFYYDFIDVYIDRSRFEYCEMDTDSAYIAFSEKDLRSCIKPELLSKYEAGLTAFCSDDVQEADADMRWFPRTCCERHAKFDKRTPGLFKEEYSGDEIISLASKSYIVRDGNQYKFSCKGVNKKNVENPMETYTNVLETKQPSKAVNRGFRYYNHSVYTYLQEKRGFSYFYCKREVLQDGRNTIPLDVVISPADDADSELEQTFMQFVPT
jgi:hypothetical protein